VQRLFSTFPHALPGVGLLLLRLAAGSPLIIDAIHGLLRSNQVTTVAVQLGAIGIGACLIAGVWTPIAGALQVTLELWTVLSRTGTDRSALLLGAIAASVMMLGPGAWSVDARRFGRKRIDLQVR
jgi:putative oxidoreductase